MHLILHADSTTRWTVSAPAQNPLQKMQYVLWKENMQYLVLCFLFMHHCAGVGVLGSQLYAAGGHDGPLVRKSVEVYDPQTNTWRLVCDMNMCRRNAGQKTHTDTRITCVKRNDPAEVSDVWNRPLKVSVPLTVCCT